MTQTPGAPSTKPIISTHDLGEIVGYGYRIYLSNFVVMFMLALFTVPLQLLSGAVERTVSEDNALTVQYLFQVPTAIVSVIITGAVVFATHRVALGAKPSFPESLDAVFERLWALIGTGLLAGVCAAAALLAAPLLGLWWLLHRDATVDGRRDWWMWVVPGALTIYLAIRWAFVTQAVVIQEKRNWAALDDVANAVRGSWWRTLGILIVLTLIAFAPTMVATPAAQLDPLAAAAIFGLLQAATLPFYAVGQTLLYYDLKTRTMPVDASLPGPEAEPALEEPE